MASEYLLGVWAVRRDVPRAFAVLADDLPTNIFLQQAAAENIVPWSFTNFAYL